MMENELLLEDRLAVIRQAYIKYDLEHTAYLSFSGGKDSTVLHYLIDLAVPGNRIPRVFIDTGIEYKMIRDFVLKLAEKDGRFQFVRPDVPIKKLLNEKGYPFKSKEHSMKLQMWQAGSRSPSIMKYKNGGSFQCPKSLMYQFSDDFHIKVSDVCCRAMKKKTSLKWLRENNRTVTITGMRKGEGGQRANLKGCILTDKDGNLKKFHPLLPIPNGWEDWFVERNHIELCELYYPPFNFKRTGCKGCPFSLDLQEQLTIMEKYLPNEAKQCEAIWKPIYDEYRRIGFRLKNNIQLDLFDEE